MMIYSCFKEGCKNKAQYLCLCLSSETYSCEFHLESHFKLPNRVHSFDSILQKPCEWAKDEVLGVLTEEKSKKEKLKQIVLAFITQNVCKTNENFREGLRKINSDLEEINNLIEKVCQIPEKNQAPNILILEPEVKIMIPKDSELYNCIKLFYSLNKLRYSTSNILNRANNDPETEQYFRKTCKKYENFVNNPLLSQAYQELIKTYEKLTYHYSYQEHNLFIYNTETEKEEKIKVPIIDKYKCTSKLPNGELFCLSNFNHSTHAQIINKNYGTRILPSKMLNLHKSIAIYFNKSVYCFGGKVDKNSIFGEPDVLRFDLDKNRWIILNKMQRAANLYNIIIFQRNILISNSQKRLLMYSVDIDSFSEIPYKFPTYWKLLINGGDRLYVITRRIIYESEDEFSWIKTVTLRDITSPNDTYYSYNKGGIYIPFLKSSVRYYLKLDLCNKTFIEKSYYSGDKVAFRKVGDKLEEIKCYNRIFKFDPEKYTAYFNKGYTLYDLSKSLISIDYWKRKKQNNPNICMAIGRALKNFDYHKAMKYFNKALAQDLNNSEAYCETGCILYKLNRNLEALECYNEAIKLNPDSYLSLCCRANLLYNIGQETESFKDFNQACKMKKAICLKKLTGYGLEYVDTNKSNQFTLIEKLCQLQESSLKFKGALQKTKERATISLEIIKEIEEKEKECREQHSKILEEAIFWLTGDFDNFSYSGICEILRCLLKYRKYQAWLRSMHKEDEIIQVES